MTTQMIFSQVPSYVPSNGLMGYWGFNGNANDQTPNGYNGTVNGATLTTDRFGNNNSAYSFDGVNDFISTSYSGILGTNSRSVSFWYNSNSNNTEETVFTDYGGGNNNGEGFACTLFPLNQPAVDNTGSWIKTVNSTTINNWNFYTVTYSSLDGSNLDNCKIYINGVLQSISQSSPVYDINTINGVNMVFGSSRLFDPIQFFNGKLDDIGIWNRALSQQEISNMYNGVNYSDSCNAVSGSLVNGLVAYYPFCGNANDQSGNGLNGVVNGAILTSDRFGNSNSAYVFDGNSKIRCAFSNQFSPDASDNYSFSFWAENTSNNFGMILQYYTYNPTENISNYDFFNSLPSCPSGSYAFQNFPFNSPGGCSPTLVNLNEWNHIVVVIKQVEQTFNVFKNGVFWFNGNVGNIKPYAGFLTIGNVISDTFGYNGKIDDIGIWNRALIPQEITQLYNQNQCVTNITVTDTLIINVGQLSYTNPVTYANNITIYPNPANTQVNISFNNITDLTGGNINIVNSLGQQVATTPITLSGTNTTMQLNSWGGTGLYFVQILNAQGIVVDVKKIILQ